MFQPEPRCYQCWLCTIHPVSNQLCQIKSLIVSYLVHKNQMWVLDLRNGLERGINMNWCLCDSQVGLTQPPLGWTHTCILCRQYFVLAWTQACTIGQMSWLLYRRWTETPRLYTRPSCLMISRALESPSRLFSAICSMLSIPKNYWITWNMDITMISRRETSRCNTFCTTGSWTCFVSTAFISNAATAGPSIGSK